MTLKSQQGAHARTQLRVEHAILNTRWILKGGLVHAVLGELVNPVENHASISMLLPTSIF